MSGGNYERLVAGRLEEIRAWVRDGIAGKTGTMVRM